MIKKLSKVDIVALCLLFFISFVLISTNHLDGDMLFLQNRIKQVALCLKDGKLPFFYYHDFFELGYGSSFFYGQLTIVPFSLISMIASLDISLRLYVIIVPVFFYFSVKFFLKKYLINCNNIEFLSFLIVFSDCSLNYLFSVLYANLLGICFGFVFLGYCIDVFRENKNYIQASLAFYLLFNTHIITSVICFSICILMFIKWFSKDSLVIYAKFAFLSVLLCLYNIVNMIMHKDCLSRLDRINNSVSSILDKMTVNDIFVNFNIVKFLTKGMKGILVFPVILFICACICLYKYKLKINFMLILCILSIVLGIKDIWAIVSGSVNTYIQFPCRYLVFSICYLYISIFRFLDNKKLKNVIYISCILSIVFYSTGFIIKPTVIQSEYVDGIGTFYSDDEKNGELYSIEIANGEYLSDNFKTDFSAIKTMKSCVIDNYGNEYKYKLKKNKLVVDLSSNKNDKTIIIVPKLYYNGYKAVDKGKEFKIYEGYSMFCNIDVGNYNGVLKIYYEHPTILKVLYVFNILLVLSIIGRFFIYEKIK